MVSPSLQIQYAAQVALQRCLILRIDKAYLLYHFPYYLSIVLISNIIFCPTLRVRFKCKSFQADKTDMVNGNQGQETDMRY